jgi:hypothetical protein
MTNRYLEIETAARVVVFAGLPKTGTTSLQTVLRCNRRELDLNGYQYIGDPNEGAASATVIGSGNGYEFYRSVFESQTSELDPSLELLTPTGQNSILASESFAHLDEHQWAALRASLAVRGLACEVVIALRDIYPFIQSLHNQGAKHHYRKSRYVTYDGSGLSGSSAEQMLSGLECDLFPMLWETSLAALSAALDPGELTVLHYDSIKANLSSELLRAGSIPLDGINLQPGGAAAGPVNRSLGDGELELVEALNANFGPTTSNWAFRRLMHRTPGEPPPPPDPRVLDLIEQRYGASVKAINEKYFTADPGPKLKILDDASRSAMEHAPSNQTETQLASAARYLLSPRAYRHGPRSLGRPLIKEPGLYPFLMRIARSQRSA